MDLYQLRYFVAVAETESFTKAAARSHISQPSLSQQILNLEAELGQKLFHRLGRAVALTDPGRILFERAKGILTEADNLVRELKEDPELGHRVSVGAVPTVAHFFLPAVVAYCRTNGVRLNLKTYENFRGPLIQGVLEGEIDWALISLPISDPRVELTRLFSEPLLLAVASTHPLAARDSIEFPDLKEENFIMLGDASSLTAQIQRIGGAYDFEPIVTHRCAQLATVKSFAAMGLGVSVLPQSARSANDPEGLVYRRFSGKHLVREIVLVRHRRHFLSKGARAFAEAAHAVVGPQPPAPAAR